jgi:hypothetical protein
MGNTGELPATANGGAAVSTTNSGGPRPSSHPSNLYRTLRDQRLTKANTPSWVIFLKRPPISSKFHPQSLIRWKFLIFDLL